MSPETASSGGPDDSAKADREKLSESTPKEAPEQIPERRHFRRYRMSMPAWLSYGRNFRQVESGLVRDVSKTGIFVITEGAKELNVGDLVKINATFAVRGEARVIRMESGEAGSQGIGLEFTEKLELDI